LGASLLNTYERFGYTDSAAFSDDLYNVAITQAAAGDVDRAIELYTEAIHLTFNYMGAGVSVAAKLTNLAALLSEYEQHDSAVRVFMQALLIRRRILPHNSEETGDSFYNIGKALNLAGRYREALAYLNSAMHIYAKISGKAPVYCLSALAYAHENLEEYEEAFRFAEAAWKGVGSDNAEEHYKSGYYLANLYESGGFFDKAGEIYLSILKWVEEMVGKSHSLYVNIGTKAANMLAQTGDYEQAKAILKDLRESIKEFIGHDNITYSNCTRNLAVIHRQLEEWEEAEALLGESIIIKKRIVGGHVRDFASDCMLLLDICVKSDRAEKAAEILLSVLMDVPDDDPAFIELLDEMNQVFKDFPENNEL